MNCQIGYVYYLDINERQMSVESLLDENLSFRLLNESRIEHLDGLVRFEPIDQTALEQFHFIYMNYLLEKVYFAVTDEKAYNGKFYQKDLTYLNNVHEQLCPNDLELQPPSYKSAFNLVN